MKKITKISALHCLLFIALGIFYTNGLKAQYIIAGQHGTNDFYANPNKLDFVVFQYFVGPPDTASYYIDMNGDGTNDVVIYGNAGGACPICYVTECGIFPVNKNRVVYGFPDSCFTHSGVLDAVYPMAMNFKMNDTISYKAFKWDTAFSYVSYTSNGPYGSSDSYNCNGSFNNTDTAYMGVMVLKASDTLYGWIRVTNVENGQNDTVGCKIIDYACEITPNSINEIQNNVSVKVYPSPSTGIITIQARGIIPDAIVEVYNMLGEKVYSKALRQTRGNNNIDISTQPDGIYLYRVMSDSGNLIGTGKLVIQK
jgi:hypothetical protein